MQTVTITRRHLMEENADDGSCFWPLPILSIASSQGKIEAK